MTSTEHTLAQGTFCWFEHGSRDRDAAKAFYSAVLGWTFEDDEMPGDMPGTYTMVRADGKDIGGMYEMEGEMFDGVPANWMGYVAVDDVDATAAAAREAGAKLIYEPMDVPGVGRLALFADPTGAHLSVWTGCEGGHPGGGSDPQQMNTFCWAELMTRDLERARTFYAEVIGWEIVEQEMGNETVTLLKVGDTDTGDMRRMSEEFPEEVPAHWMYFVQVADVDATCAAVEEHGGTVCVPPFDIQVGRLAVIIDPAGAGLSLITLEDPRA